MRYFPITAAKGIEAKQVAPNVPKDDFPNKWRFYALRTRGSNSDDEDDDDKSLYLFRV